MYDNLTLFFQHHKPFLARKNCRKIVTSNNTIKLHRAKLPSSLQQRLTQNVHKHLVQLKSSLVVFL